MIKRVFIPLAVLGKQKSELLELYIESRWFKPASCFSGLRSSGLSMGIEIAEMALSSLKQPFGAGMVATTNCQPSLSNAQGTSAGLAMSYIMTLRECHYQTLIVSAGLELSASKDYLLEYTGFWQQKLTAILNLEPSPYTVPLILAQDTPLKAAEIEVLLQHNIQPYLFNSLSESIEFCLQSKLPIEKH